MKAIIVLKLSSKSNSELLEDIKRYIARMTGNPLFAALIIIEQLASTSTVVLEMESALSESLGRLRTQKVKTLRVELEKRMTFLAKLVENVANSSSVTTEEQRESIVASAGMELKGKSARQKQIFGVETGPIEGSVFLSAEAGVAAHMWEYTTDLTNFTERIAVEPTTTSNTIVFGLNKLTKYAFFHKPIKSGEVGQWEGPLFYTVVN